jgi:membrane protein implicated in regulation of membrane protease activity
MKKKMLFFAIIIATLSFTACSEKATYAPAPTEMIVDGPGITIPGDSVYFEYQVPVLGRWLDCNLKNKGNKKLLGWLTKGVWKKAPDKYISDDELNAHKYSYTGDTGVVVSKNSLKNYAKVTINGDGSVTPEVSSNVDPEMVKQSVTYNGSDSDSCFLGFPLLYWLIAIALTLLIIWLFLSIRDRNQPPPPVNNLTAGTGTGGQTVITVANNANASVNVASGGTTITHNP